jgi:hypothetical protein
MDWSDTIDVVIIGYLRGRGMRAALGIGAVLDAGYDPRTDSFQSIAKIRQRSQRRKLAENSPAPRRLAYPRQTRTSRFSTDAGCMGGTSLCRHGIGRRDHALPYIPVRRTIPVADWPFDFHASSVLFETTSRQKTQLASQKFKRWPVVKGNFGSDQRTASSQLADDVQLQQRGAPCTLPWISCFWPFTLHGSHSS